MYFRFSKLIKESDLMFLKTLMTSLLSALALTTPGTVADQGANSNQVDLPKSNAVDSYVPMSTNAELDI